MCQYVCFFSFLSLRLQFTSYVDYQTFSAYPCAVRAEIVLNSQSREEYRIFLSHLNLNAPNETEFGFDGITPLNFTLIEFIPNIFSCSHLKRK